MVGTLYATNPQRATSCQKKKKKSCAVHKTVFRRLRGVWAYKKSAPGSALCANVRSYIYSNGMPFSSLLTHASRTRRIHLNARSAWRRCDRRVLVHGLGSQHGRH